MPAPLSKDIRERVVKAWFEGEETQGQIALRFDVGVASVVRFLARYRKVGNVDPDENIGGRTQRKIDEAGEQALRAWVAEEPDLTIHELTCRYNDHHPVQVSEATVGRALRRMGLTRKKRR